jgi:hypothetical protein
VTGGVDWRDLFAALALVLVIEGLTPFLSPATFKRAMGRAAELPESALRAMGFAALAGGALLLWWVRG